MMEDGRSFNLMIYWYEKVEREKGAKNFDVDDAFFSLFHARRPPQPCHPLA